jgi:hypothetical protein
MANYYTYKEQTFTCKHCGAACQGNKAVEREEFSDGIGIHCPSCKAWLDVVLFPTHAERKAFLEKVRTSQLKDIAGLPELEGDKLTFTLREDTVEIVVYMDEREIWRERYDFEYHERFIDLGKLLQQKYGQRMVDFVPDVNDSYLYGFDHGGKRAALVEEFRASLKKP